MIQGLNPPAFIGLNSFVYPRADTVDKAEAPHTAKNTHNSEFIVHANHFFENLSEIRRNATFGESLATSQSLRFSSFKEEMKDMPKITKEEGLARLAAIEARMTADLFAKPSQRSKISSTFVSTMLGSLEAHQPKKHNLLNSAPSHYLPDPPIQTPVLPKMDYSLVQDRQIPSALVFPKPPVGSGLCKEPKITLPSQQFFQPLSKPQLQPSDLSGSKTAWNNLMRPQSLDRTTTATPKVSLPSPSTHLRLPGASASLLQEPKPLAAPTSVSNVSLLTHKPALRSQAPSNAWEKMQVSGRFRTNGVF